MSNQAMEIIMETNRFRARLSIALMCAVPTISRFSAPLAFSALWLAWKIGEGQYRINGGSLRPLSREVIERQYMAPDGIDSEVWVPVRNGGK